MTNVLQDSLQRGNSGPLAPKHLKNTGIFRRYETAARPLFCRHCDKSRCYTDFPTSEKPEQLMLATSVSRFATLLTATQACSTGERASDGNQANQ